MPRLLAPLLAAITLLPLAGCLPAGSGEPVTPATGTAAPVVRLNAVEAVPVRAVPTPRTDYGPDPAELGERAERLARKLSRVPKPRVRPPEVSVGEGRVKGERRPRPVVTVPDVWVYEDAVCVDTPRSHVHIGKCRVTPRKPAATRRPRNTPGPDPVRRAVQTPTPTPTPTKVEPTPTPEVRIGASSPVPPQRANPLGTVLLMVVLSTVIASATAVAFGTVK